MADRIMVWHIETVIGDGTNQGPTFIADKDYSPHVVRVHAKRAPDAGVLEFDIKDDGVSIFPLDRPYLRIGSNTEEVAEDWPETTATIARYSLVSLDLVDCGGGAHGITVQLELIADEDDGDRAESDT